MATYSSYKKITSEGIPDGSITRSKLTPGAGACRRTQWVFNERGMQCHMCARNSGCCQQANGRCCYWCAPDNVYKVTFESGAVAAVVQDTHVVTVVLLLLAEQVVTMQYKR